MPYRQIISNKNLNRQFRVRPKIGIWLPDNIELRQTADDRSQALIQTEVFETPSE